MKKQEACVCLSVAFFFYKIVPRAAILHSKKQKKTKQNKTKNKNKSNNNNIKTQDIKIF